MLPSLAPPPWFMLFDDPFCVFGTGLLTACSPYKDVSPVRGAGRFVLQAPEDLAHRLSAEGLLSEEGVLPRALAGPPHRLNPWLLHTCRARPTFPLPRPPRGDSLLGQ